MYELTPVQAQNIVDRMMKDIPYNINIMDHTGRIIGSGNKERIGTLHHGAVEAIRQKKGVDITKDERFVKKGINLPIELNGRIVGVVGISGEVVETRPFGNLLRSAVILLIEQSMALERENLKNALKQEFFQVITDPETAYTKELAEQASVYGIQLAKPSRIIYMEAPDEMAEEPVADLASFKPSGHSLCLVIQEDGPVEALLERIADLYPEAFMTVSHRNETVAAGYSQARAAMRVLKGVFFQRKRLAYAECEFIADMAKLQKQKNDPKAERLAHLLEKNEELIRTLQVYLQCNLNANETASRLIIHRNTLNYRLSRIHKTTGKDPKNLLELVELLFMLVYRAK